jgi:hypothetical protein
LSALLALLFSSPVAMGDEITLPFTFTKPAGDSPFPAVVILHDRAGLGPQSPELENVTYHSEVKQSRAFLET